MVLPPPLAADQDVRGFGVQVDGDGAAGGADTDERGSFGHRLDLLAQVGGVEAQHRGECGLVLHGAVFLICAGPGEPGVLQG
ncbi:hypothetical protein ACFTWN_32825 [Streptomyces sp. NPDC057092]|uniref:hypothetical protein n=1 Tax=Streptomyces sp. NPDC057092 TaxID=3346017 RepID=UPI00362CD4D6